MNEAVVKAYLAKLETAFGDDDAFMAVFDAMRCDAALEQAEAVALASRFVAPTTASTTKSKAFDRILRRHKNLVSFKLKQRAVGGRSAA